MQHAVFYQLSIVLVLATAVSLACKLFKQPAIIGYLVTGLLVGPAALNLLTNADAFTAFSQIGIVLLLFIVGLGLNLSVIRSTGRPVALVFAVIAAGVGLAAFLTSFGLGLSLTDALMVSVALLFSSTIVVVKTLSDKQEQGRLYGQITIGILLLEDVVATIALVAISATSNGGFSWSGLLELCLKGLCLALLLILAGMDVMPRLARLFAGSQELLYVFALAWGFGVASLFQVAGFSVEVGALFAGVSLAHLPYAQEISTRLKPLRDFFVVLFFVELGSSLGRADIVQALLPAVLFSVIILVLKPLLILMGLGALGYTKRTGFKVAVHLSQISEFSVVFIVLAVTLGVVDARLSAIITLTAVITILVSTYLMAADNALYHRLASHLSRFERTDVKRELVELRSYPLVLLGYHGGGHEFIETFRQLKKRYVVIDYDPAVVDILQHQHINHLYGDATDLELLDEIGVHKAEVVISTITDHESNRLLLSHVARRNPKTIFICHAGSYDEAKYLYDHGAAYVLLPHFIGNERINGFLRRHGTSKPAFENYREHHLTSLSKALVNLEQS